jgi:hypothetical protein
MGHGVEASMLPSREVHIREVQSEHETRQTIMSVFIGGSFFLPIGVSSELEPIDEVDLYT